MRDWKLLDFGIPEDSTEIFEFMVEKYGDRAGIYVTVVGDHNNAAEATLGYQEGTTHKMQLTDENIAKLREFCEKAKSHGVYLLWRRAVVPAAPESYRIIPVAKCGAGNWSCDFFHDGYCELGEEEDNTAPNACAHRKETQEVSCL